MGRGGTSLLEGGESGVRGLLLEELGSGVTGGWAGGLEYGCGWRRVTSGQPQLGGPSSLLGGGEWVPAGALRKALSPAAPLKQKLELFETKRLSYLLIWSAPLNSTGLLNL